MHLYDTLKRLGGVGTLNELRASGPISRRELARELASGSLIRLGPGRFAVPSAPQPMRHAVQVDGVVSCVSALRILGFDVPGDSSVTHCSVPEQRGTTRRRCPPGVRKHYEPVRRVQGRRVTPAPDAFGRAARCLDYLNAVALLDVASTNRRAPSTSEILAEVRRHDRHLAASLALDVAPGVRSLRESAPRLALRAAGLATSAAVTIPGVGEVDLLIEGVIVVEIDGFAYHSGRSPFRSDRRRDRRLVHLGFRVIRYAWEDAEPHLIVEDVLALLAASRDPQPFSPQVAPSVRHEIEALRRSVVDPENRRVSRRARTLLAPR